MGPIDLGRKRGRSDGDILVGCLTSEVASSAKDIDENSRFPEEALVALNVSGLNAIHVPQAYGGQGADSVATRIVIEEVARVCGSSSLIAVANKLGTMALILEGSEELKHNVLPDVANGQLASYALSEREAGAESAAMRTHATADGHTWTLNGSESRITNGAKSS
jgi:alkylation response protein AidB-like acyl-CoA dehydrogenase